MECFQYILLVMVMGAVANSQDCSGGYKFVVQPPSTLSCNPLGRFITLTCVVSESIKDPVTWYWSQSAGNAGVNGTAILPGDNSDAYLVSTQSSPTQRSTITFTGTQSTLGYYWCEISNVMNLRPSIITPVCQPTNTSLPLCTNTHIAAIHNSNPECAAVGSPIVYTRTPLPSSCVTVISSHALMATTAPLPVPLTPTNTITAAATTTHASWMISHTATSVTVLTTPLTSSLAMVIPASGPTTTTVTVTTTTAIDPTIVVLLVVSAYAVCTTLTILVLVPVLVCLCFRMRTNTITSMVGTPVSCTNKRVQDDDDDLSTDMKQNEAYSIVTLPSTQQQQIDHECNHYETIMN